MKLLSILLCLAPLVFGNACVSNATGLSNVAGTWTSCGGTFPQDGDTVLVNGGFTVTINGNLGTNGNGIKGITAAGGTILTDGASPHTIVLAQTGTDPKGSGSCITPGTDATIFGLRTKNSGVIDFSAATPTNTVTIVGGYIASHTDGGGAANTIKMSNYVLQTAGIADATCDLAWGITLTNGVAGDVYDFNHGSLTSFNRVKINDNGTNPGGNFSFNTITGGRSSIIIEAVSAGRWTIDSNTVSGTTLASSFITQTNIHSTSYLTRNVILSDAGKPVPLISNGSATPAGDITGSWVERYNVVLYPAGTNPAGIVGISACGTVAFPSLVDSNIVQAFEANIANNTGCTGTTITNNFLVQNTANNPGQGQITHNGGTATISGNVLAWDSANSANFAALLFSNLTFVWDRNTVFYNAGNTDGRGLEIGDGGILPITLGTVKNSIFQNAAITCVNDTTASNSYTQEFNSAGVHHNDTFGCGGTGYTTSGGAHFQNGGTTHPNAAYGDLTTNPSFVDTTRRAETYDSIVAGGAGTFASMATGFGKRNGLNGALNSAYDPVAMLKWIMPGFAPTASAVKTGASDGGYMGAVNPVSGSFSGGPITVKGPRLIQ